MPQVFKREWKGKDGAVKTSKVYYARFQVNGKDIVRSKVDSLLDGELWFESMCVMKSGPQRLLLSGYDLGHPVDCPIVQTGLDFSDREKELFQSSEMGPLSSVS
jgi:hypothetical protein